MSVHADSEVPSAARSAASFRALNLTLSFGPRDILAGVSTEIMAGLITALIGPTGSGKTTLLRTLNRMNDKVPGYRHGGDVELGGRSIWHPSVELMALRRRVGMLFQRPNPFPMSIIENVVAGPRTHKMARRQQLREIAERRLSQVGLWDAVKDRLGDSPFQLSGGQQQLLCLARALAVNPDVLLLDEPTSSLDPKTTEMIEALIKSLTPGITVVIVTHNLGQAKRVSHRTMFLHSGQLVEHDDTARIFSAPAQDQTRHYIEGRYG
jgi:phosphate transport system ATP-binding protein